MAGWLNHVVISAPRNATTTHTVTPSSGTVVAGSLFTPTAGRFLVALCGGGVTFTTPSGWTLPGNGSAIANSGHYVFYKASAAGGDSLTTTHNGSDYPIFVEFFEFASGTTWVSCEQAAAVAPGVANPTVTGMTGGNNFACASLGWNTQALTPTTLWSAGTESCDAAVLYESPIEGWYHTSTYVQDYASATWTSTPELTDAPAAGGERLTWAVAVASSDPNSVAVGKASETNTARAVVLSAAVTRYYLPGVTSPPASPLPSLAAATQWNITPTGFHRAKTSTTKANSTIVSETAANFAETSTSTVNVAHVQYVTDPIGAQTISGTFGAVVRGGEDNNAANASLQVVIRVVSGDGATLRGTLYAGHSSANNSTAGALGQEFGTSSATRIIPNTAMSSVTAENGDRIVIELGFRHANTTATSYGAYFSLGDATATADFAHTAALTTTLCPWVQLNTVIAPPTDSVSVGKASESDTAPTVTVSGGATDVVLATADFEGTNGATVTNANSGLTSDPTGSGTSTFDTSVYKAGTSSMKVATSSNTKANLFEFAAQTKVGIRWYGRLQAYPASALNIVNFLDADSNVIAGFRISTAGVVTARDGSASAVGTSLTLTAGQWYRAWYVVEPGGLQTLKLYIGASLEAVITAEDNDSTVDIIDGEVTATAAVTTIQIGVPASNTLTQWFDDVAVIGNPTVEPAPTGGAASVDAGKATETDTARAITVASVASIAVGKPTETDTSRAATITSSGSLAAGRPTEADTARPVGISSTGSLAVGKATEADAALSVTSTGGASVAAGKPSEADTARSITWTGAGTQAVGRPAETDLARAITWTSTGTKPVGRVTEADTAQTFSITSAGSLSVAPATETDTAYSIGTTGASDLPVGKATEADTSVAITQQTAFLLAVGRPTETDTPRAFTYTSAGALAVARAVEIDLGRVIVPTQAAATNLAVKTAVETDTSGRIAVLTGGMVGFEGWGFFSLN